MRVNRSATRRLNRQTTLIDSDWTDAPRTKAPDFGEIDRLESHAGIMFNTNRASRT